MRQVLRLAWPAVLSMLLHTVMTITDAFWVGRLGADEMAAVITSLFVIWMIFSLVSILDAGTVAVISRFCGARNFERVSHSARQAVTLGLAFSVVFTILGLLTADLLFDVMDTSERVAELGAVYLRTIFGITLCIFMTELMSAIFRSSGDTKTPLIVSSTAIALNLILDPLLIFGWGLFPRLEVAGAALATAISYSFGLLLYLIVVKAGRLTFPFNWSEYKRPDFKILWQMIKIGTPMSISGVVFSVVYLFMTRITAAFGTEPIAALGIGNRLESISFLICFGFSMAVSALVGQNLGALKPERAERSVYYSMAITGVITTLIALAFVLVPRQLAAFFIADAEVQAITVDYLIIIAASQPAMAVVIMIEGAFIGAGNTMPPMITTVCYALARLPIAYLLCFNFGVGVNGVWWAISVTMIVAAVVMLMLFRRGKWKLQEIH